MATSQLVSAVREAIVRLIRSGETVIYTQAMPIAKYLDHVTDIVKSAGPKYDKLEYDEFLELLGVFKEMLVEQQDFATAATVRDISDKFKNAMKVQISPEQWTEQEKAANYARFNEIVGPAIVEMAAEPDEPEDSVAELNKDRLLRAVAARAVELNDTGLCQLLADNGYLEVEYILK